MHRHQLGSVFSLVDAAQALSELTALSAQITSAIVVDGDGAPLASTLDDDRAGGLAQTVQELLAAADRVGDGRPVLQLEVATADGSVFLVRDGDVVIAATTRPEPAAGLVFYDLKATLRSIREEPKPKPKARKKSDAAA
jgi:predicted regulator of Ras-like GTPase activity (Roadblock/LC7/MglB family)